MWRLILAAIFSVGLMCGTGCDQKKTGGGGGGSGGEEKPPKPNP